MSIPSSRNQRVESPYASKGIGNLDGYIVQYNDQGDIESTGTLFSAITKTATATFTQANLVAGVYTFNHALDRIVQIEVYDENEVQFSPDTIDRTDSNNATIDVSSWGDITGKTFTVIAIG